MYQRVQHLSELGSKSFFLSFTAEIKYTSPLGLCNLHKNPGMAYDSLDNLFPMWTWKRIGLQIQRRWREQRTNTRTRTYNPIERSLLSQSGYATALHTGLSISKRMVCAEFSQRSQFLNRSSFHVIKPELPSRELVAGYKR